MRAAHPPRPHHTMTAALMHLQRQQRNDNRPCGGEGEGSCTGSARGPGYRGGHVQGGEPAQGRPPPPPRTAPWPCVQYRGCRQPFVTAGVVERDGEDHLAADGADVLPVRLAQTLCATTYPKGAATSTRHSPCPPPAPQAARTHAPARRTRQRTRRQRLLEVAQHVKGAAGQVLYTHCRRHLGPLACWRPPPPAAAACGKGKGAGDGGKGGVWGGVRLVLV